MDKFKQQIDEFDPKLKMLIALLFLVTMITIVFLRVESVEEIPYEEAVVELEEIEDDYSSGFISSGTARSRSSSVRGGMESAGSALKDAHENFSDYTGLPGWAVQAGIPEIGGFTLIPEKSVIVSPNEKYVNSFTAVYTGEGRSLISEAKRISKEMDLSVVSSTSHSFAAKGGVSDYAVSVNVSTTEEGYQLKYGASESKNF